VVSVMDPYSRILSFLDRTLYNYRDKILLSQFWTLSIVLILFKTRRFGDWILSPFSWNLLSWAQWIEVVSVSRRETDCLYLLVPTE
jgi:hypothetical protein